MAVDRATVVVRNENIRLSRECVLNDQFGFPSIYMYVFLSSFALAVFTQSKVSKFESVPIERIDAILQ